jgi:hypothetical protein
VLTRLGRDGLALASVLALALTLGGCGAGLPIISGAGPLVPGATDAAPARERAQAVLSRWAKAVADAGGQASVIPVGELTGQIGDWEAAVGDNNKVALMAGAVVTEKDLSAVDPGHGTVIWQDGSTTAVPILSAQEAIGAIALTAEASCSGCTMLTLTGAQLSSGPIQTTRGPATAPIWTFTVRNSAVKVTRVAIADAMVVSPLVGEDSDLGLAIDSARGSVTGTDLAVSFVGAPDPGTKACGEDYTADAVESDLAVVVIVTRHRFAGPSTGFCTLVGARRTATATLARPLGTRAVLDLQQGTPVPVVVDP